MNDDIFSEEQIEKIKEIVIKVLKEELNIAKFNGVPLFKFEKEE